MGEQTRAAFHARLVAGALSRSLMLTLQMLEAMEIEVGQRLANAAGRMHSRPILKRCSKRTLSNGVQITESPRLTWQRSFISALEDLMSQYVDTAKARTQTS